MQNDRPQQNVKAARQAAQEKKQQTFC